MAAPIEKERFWKKVTISNGCWIWTGAVDSSGYGSFRFRETGKKTESAHRVSWFFRNGVIPESLCVLPKCDTRLCVRPSHLFLGTKEDNNDDCHNKMRHMHGESHTSAVLSESDVMQIRSLYKKGSSKNGQVQLAKKFGISHRNIRHVLSGTTWKHLTQIN